LTSHPDIVDNFCMDGHVRRNRQNWYIDLHWKGERLRLFSDRDGNPLFSERQANRLLEKIRSEIDYDDFDPKNYIKRELKGLRWDNYLDAWVERQTKRREAGEISREYLRMIQSLVKHHIREMFRNRSIRDLNKGMIDDAFTALPKHLSTKTKANIQGIVSKVLKDAHDRGDIARVPKMTRVKVADPRTTFIEEYIQERLLAEIRNPVTLAFFRFCMLHGCRPGEARALQWADIKDGYITIAASMDQDEYRPYTKTKRIRVIPLHPECAAELATLPRAIDNNFVFTLKGKPLRKEYVNMTWRRAAKRAGVQVCCYEGTRHSWISQRLNAGAPAALVREVVGHQSAKTMDRYKHIKAESLRPLIERQQTVSSTSGAKGKLLKLQR
jgi:integrase